MAVPARKTSKAKKAKRRTHYKLPRVTLTKDAVTGEWKVPHRKDREEA